MVIDSYRNALDLVKPEMETKNLSSVYISEYENAYLIASKSKNDELASITSLSLFVVYKDSGKIAPYDRKLIGKFVGMKYC